MVSLTRMELGAVLIQAALQERSSPEDVIFESTTSGIRNRSSVDTLIAHNPLAEVFRVRKTLRGTRPNTTLVSSATGMVAIESSAV